MNTAKRLGIWMDHSIVHLMEYSPDLGATKTIGLKLKNQFNFHPLGIGTGTASATQEQNQGETTDNLEDIIKNYDEVVLFGPIDPKAELYNSFNAEHSFSKTRIEIKQTDKMTESEQHDFVKAHFSGSKFNPLAKYVENKTNK